MMEEGQVSAATPTIGASGEPPPPTPTSTSSEFIFFLLTILGVIVTDALAMLFLHQFQLSPRVEILLNIIFLSIVTAPILYFLWFAPLKKQLHVLEKLAEELRAERDYAKRIVQGTPAMVCVIDPDGKTRFINRAAEQASGYTCKDIVGHDWWNLCHPGKRSPRVEDQIRSFSESEVKNVEISLITKAGKPRHILWNSIRHYDNADEFMETLAFGNDITQSKLEHDSIEELAKFPSENPHPVLRFTPEGAVIYANQPGVTLLHRAQDGPDYNMPESWLSVLKEAWDSGTNKVMEDEIGERVLRLTFTPIATDNYVNVYGADISDLKRLEDELRRLSHIDGLTAIPNRRTFNEMLEREWLRGRRNKASLAVVMIDVDDFKLYNDHYGHQPGDQCLRSIATALSKSLRRPSDFVSRYGGEEFAAILPNTDEQGAKEVAEAMRRSVETMNKAHAAAQNTNIVTISLGTATIIPSEGATAGQLISAADDALYQSKNAGKNRVSLGEIKGPATE